MASFRNSFAIAVGLFGFLSSAFPSTPIRHFFPASHDLDTRTVENLTATADFFWPTERPWYADYQKTAPCGTNASVTARTNFPIDAGSLSLIMAKEAYSLTLSIAYTNDPTTQSDFNVQVLKTGIVQAGHRCFTAPNTSMAAGTNATIQMQYISSFNGSVYETYYSCADITFVTNADFKETVDCFNATVTTTSPDGVESSPSSTASTISPSSKGKKSLSKGAIAGIVVGCVVLLGLLGIGAVILMRRRNLVKRMSKPGDTDAIALKDFSRINDAPSVTSRQTGPRT